MNLVEKYGFKAEMLHSVLDHLYSEKYPISKLINYFLHVPYIWYCINLVSSITSTGFPSPV